MAGPDPWSVDMRVAIPVADDLFCPHFGRCTQVTLAEVDLESRTVDRLRTLVRPKQGCDSLPTWLAELAVETVVVGGIGGGAIANLQSRGIGISAGHSAETPAEALESYLASPAGGPLSGCDHHHHNHQHCRHD
jgi:predicted Fe-Mo cluster-binding NifX family protein